MQEKIINSLIVEIVSKYKLWFFIAYREILTRYERSVLGPLWITIGTALVIFILGPFYGKLLNSLQKDYLLYLSSGLIFWIFISSFINASCVSITQNKSMILSREINPLGFVLKDLIREVIILFHNLPLLIFLIIYTYKENNFNFLLILANFFAFICAFVLIVITLFFLGCLLSIICARYRDIITLISNSLILFFFITPVLWERSILGDKFKILNLNLITYYLDIFRNPMLNIKTNFFLYFIMIIFIVFLYIVTEIIYRKYKNKLKFWL